MNAKKKIGFACLEPDLLKSLAVMGGRASHDPAKPKKNRAHEWTADTARQAALKMWENRRKKAALTELLKRTA